MDKAVFFYLDSLSFQVFQTDRSHRIGMPGTSSHKLVCYYFQRVIILFGSVQHISICTEGYCTLSA